MGLLGSEPVALREFSLKPMGPLLLLPDEILDQNKGPQHKKDIELWSRSRGGHEGA